jgi:membrane fusion protein (multidrug efflux system)
VTLRAEFPNPDGVLLPGMYVRVSVEQATSAAAIAIPSQAVQRSASGAAQVYVVTAEGTAALKPVVLGRATGNRVIVEEGLSEGETLIVDGFQKMGPGAPVAPVCWADPSLSEPPADVCIQRLGGDAAAGDTN